MLFIFCPQSGEQEPFPGLLGGLLSLGLIFWPYSEEVEVQGCWWPQQLGRIQTQLLINEWISNLAHVRTTTSGSISHLLNLSGLRLGGQESPSNSDARPGLRL